MEMWNVEQQQRFMKCDNTSLYLRNVIGKKKKKVKRRME
jgi:hypothetical protein